MGSAVIAKAGERENNTREGMIRRTRKEVVGFVQAMLGKNIVKFEDGQKIEMISFSFTQVCSE